MITLQGAADSRLAAGQTIDALGVYRKISASPTVLGAQDPFTFHIFACVLSLAIVEAQELGESVGACCGLAAADLGELIRNWAPAARAYISPAEPTRIVRDDEETQVAELLARFCADDGQMTGWIVAIVTRRAMSPNHLWQDLGLFSRDELTQLMQRFFPALASANVDNMKWKKFLYRQLCALEGFSLCAAPTCRACGDFDHCFGEETGESALARLARR